MNRREMLAAVAAAPGLLTSAATAQDERPDPSLYIPNVQRVEDREFLLDFMDDFPFVDLITASPTLRITHIPTVLDRTAGRYGTILGHISAQNPQRAAFDAHGAVIVCHGPQGYISPSWYASRPAVPTWNFSVVHASGRPKAITDPVRTRALLARLIKKFEATVGSTSYDFAAQPDSFVSGLMKGIAPFEMEIEALEGKFKLGQERSDGDRQGVLTHLRQGGYHERSLYDLTDAFYRERPK